MQLPSHEYRRTDHKKPKKPYSGLDAAVNGWVGRFERRGRVLEELERVSEAAVAVEGRYRDLSDHDLRDRLTEFADRFRRRGRGLDAALPEALAAIREAAERRVGLRAFAVQLMGALALHRGKLAEMATGEGKTLTAGLAAVLAGWTGYPCHIITANDYLVQRDAEWLKPLYVFCRLKVGHVTGQMPSLDRKHGYAADITYTTSKEIVADFLRDRLRLGVLADGSRRMVQAMLNPQVLERGDLVMRGLHTAIVDEADSLLIDEAVTPLIISAPLRNDTLREACILADEMVTDFIPGEDYEVNLRHREVDLTEAGRGKMRGRCERLPGLFRSLNRRSELARQALVAREFFHNGRQYAVVDGKVMIVDEFTGRIMPQRSWRAGLHQAIEAKERLTITDPTETLARLSFQRFYRLFYKLSGMTGTAREASGEFWQVYGLPVVAIPTNRPCLRVVGRDRVFVDADSKWEAIAEEIARLHATGRPILVGTRSIQASERLGDRLQELGLHYRVLNALRLAEEAQIVADAGQEGRITIATNMAGRGTDIRLGAGVAGMGGLHVLASERHESHRIDRQLFGRSARQGDPGSAQAFLSLEDELIVRYVPAGVLGWLRGRLGRGEVSGDPLARRVADAAQWRAERQAFRQREGVLKTDTWLDEALSFAGPTGGG